LNLRQKNFWLTTESFSDQVPAVVDPVTTFKEEEFKHLEWDKDVGVFEDTYVPAEAPALTAEQGCYVSVGADGSIVDSNGAIFQVLANGTLKSPSGAILVPTGVLLSVANELVSSDLAFEGVVALADGIKLEEGRKFVIKEQKLAEGEMFITFLGGAEFVDGAGRLFRRSADGTFVGADLDNLECWSYAGVALMAKDCQKLEGDMQQGSSEWKWVIGGVELDRGAKITVKPKNKADGDILLLRSDGSLVDGTGAVYTVTPAGMLVGPNGVVLGATGLVVTPSGAAQNGAVSFANGTVVVNGSGVAAGSKIGVKKQVDGDEGMVVVVGADGMLQGLDGTKYSMRSDGKLLSEGKKVFRSTGKVVTAEQRVLTDVTASVDESGTVISINGTPLAAGAKIVIHQEEEEELEPPPKPVTIKGNVTLKDMKGDIFAEVHKDDVDGTVIGAESVIIIKNAKGKEVVRITRGYVTVKNFNVEEIVQIAKGVVSVKTMAGKEMVHVEKGEIYIEDFDGEVIVNNLADVNKLDEEMSLKNL